MLGEQRIVQAKKAAGSHPGEDRVTACRGGGRRGEETHTGSRGRQAVPEERLGVRRHQWASGREGARCQCTGGSQAGQEPGERMTALTGGQKGNRLSGVLRPLLFLLAQRLHGQRQARQDEGR